MNLSNAETQYFNSLKTDDVNVGAKIWFTNWV